MPYRTPKPFPWLELAKCLGLLAITAYLDYATGYRRSFFLFYLAPILFTLRRLGLPFALGACGLSALAWLGSNLLAGETFQGWFTPFWNTLLRLLVFFLVTGLMVVRGRLENQVRQSNRALSTEIQKRLGLEKEVLEATEREQRRIGHDLHDSLCQHLTATALAGKVLARKLAARSSPEAAAAGQLVGMVEQGIEFTRTLARSLHPIELKAEGLVDGLRELAGSISRTFPVTCKLECSQTVSLGTTEANLHLYRIAQEAISNAIRHGQSKTIMIQLKTDDHRILMTVTDDGIGLPPDAWTKGGMGLHIMNYRAGMIGAEIQAQRLPTRGTRVTCMLPETANDPADSHVKQK